MDLSISKINLIVKKVCFWGKDTTKQINQQTSTTERHSQIHIHFFSLAACWYSFQKSVLLPTCVLFGCQAGGDHRRKKLQSVCRLTVASGGVLGAGQTVSHWVEVLFILVLRLGCCNLCYSMNRPPLRVLKANKMKDWGILLLCAHTSMEKFTNIKQMENKFPRGSQISFR